MLKIYKEHPNFDQFTKFDTTTGRLTTLSEFELRRLIPNYDKFTTKSWSNRYTGDGFIFFWGENSETHTRFPRRIYFQITRRCNLNCPACFLKADSGGQDVPFEDIKNMAKVLGRHGLMEIRLTGGEPTTHPRFIDVINIFQEENIYVSLATNGVIKTQVLKDISSLKNIWIICSIDGNEEIHNHYRSNSYKKIINNLSFLKEKNPNLRLRLTTVLTKRNMHCMDDMVATAKSVGAESITVIPLRPQVRDESMKKEMVTAKEFETVIQQLVNAQIKYGVKVTTTIETDYSDKISPDPVFRKKFACAAGREGTNLDYDATRRQFMVYGCAYSPAAEPTADFKIRQPFLAGSFCNNELEKFSSIWRDESAWSIFRDLSIKPEECRNCNYYKEGHCVGSCPIQNVDFTKLNLQGKVADQLRLQLQKTGEWYCYKRVLDE